MTVYTLTVGALGTNCYLVGDTQGRAAVIDPGDEAERILKTLEENGWTCESILLTHVHFDHIGALKELRNATGAAVYCHRDEEAALTDGVRNLSALFGVPLDTVTQVKTLEEGDTVTVGELEFHVLHTPGHTAGSCCYLAEDVLFSGDTLFCESVGRIDFPGGDSTAMRRSLERLLTLEGVRAVYPGHNEPTTIDHERQYNPYVGW